MQVRLEGPEGDMAGLGVSDLAVEVGSVEGRKYEGSISFLSMGVHAKLCHPPGGAR